MIEYLLLAYLCTGCWLTVTSELFRRYAYEGSDTLGNYVRNGLRYGSYQTPPYGSYRRAGVYAAAMLRSLRAILGWPFVYRHVLVEERQHAVFEREHAEAFAALMHQVYEVEPPAEHRHANVGQLWASKVPEHLQDALPRFIHLRHCVRCMDDKSRENHGMLLTLAQSDDKFQGIMTVYRHRNRQSEEERNLPVEIAAGEVERLMRALKGVSLYRRLPASHARKRKFWQRFIQTRRIAVSTPSGAAPGLIELASDGYAAGEDDWDCVHYPGWAIDSSHARRRPYAWAADQAVGAGYETLIDALGVRSELARMPGRVEGCWIRHPGKEG